MVLILGKMKKLLGKVLRSINNALEISLGVRVKRVRKILSLVDDVPHNAVFPAATYSPWINNNKFRDVHNIAKRYTLVDEYRMYELYELAKQSASLNGAFLEVGVWQGGTSAIIQKAIDDCCSENEQPRFVIADSFEGVVKAGSPKDTNYRGGEHSDATIEDVKKLFSSANLKLPEILVGIFPDDHPEFELDRISFVHLDVDAYESTKDIIEWCLPRLIPNAILVFDDYGFRGCEGVTRYVNEFVSKNKHSFVMLHNLNGHAVLIKK